MPKKIRIYELARELGLSNEETLELTEELKIGVKSHSSSIEDPMADRVRRLADSKGIRRDPIVDEPKAEKKAAEKKTPEKKAPARAAATATATDVAEPEPAAAEGETPEPEAAEPETVEATTIEGGSDG